MYNKVRKSSLIAVGLSIIAGMGGEMHVYMPGFGTIAMLDLVSYFIALPIIFLNWNRMGKYLRLSLLWCFAWTGSAMLSNTFYFLEMRYWAKCVSLAASSWAIMASSYLLLRNSSLNYLWYLMGTGIGGWIALYHFRNGAFEYFATQGNFGAEGYGIEMLIDKQVFPVYSRGIVFGIILPLFLMWKKLPMFAVIAGVVFAGFYLLFNGGSRSSFGLFCGSGLVGFMAVYGRTILKKLGKHSMLMLLICSIGGALLFSSYKYMASHGIIGEGEAAKLEHEFGEGGQGAIKGRAGFDYAIKNAIDSYGLGLGGSQRNHSVMANALSCEGIIGFLFWVYFYVQCFWYICRRIPYTGKNATFIMLMLLTACWDVFGSPFGTRHKFFVLMTLMSLSRDDVSYGVGELYSNDLLRDQFWRYR